MRTCANDFLIQNPYLLNLFFILLQALIDRGQFVQNLNNLYNISTSLYIIQHLIHIITSECQQFVLHDSEIQRWQIKKMANYINHVTSYWSRSSYYKILRHLILTLFQHYRLFPLCVGQALASCLLFVL